MFSFIYTRCASTRACPRATGVLNEVHKLASGDPALERVRLVTMSFDPAVDTPERMADFFAWARQRESSVPWHFLTTGSRAELEPILAAYGQAVDRRENPLHPEGPLAHTLRVFLIDPAGRIRNIYSSDTLDPRLVLADVRTLLMEAARTAPGS